MTSLLQPNVRCRLPVSGMNRPCGLTIGSFDGVHIGHQAVLGELMRQCRSRGLQSSVLTFYPRPAQHFFGEAAARSLMGRREKVGTLAELGMDQVTCLKFDQHLSALSAGDFVRQVVVERLNARLVMIGDDFRFGNDRRGDYELLQQLGQKFGFQALRSPTLEWGGARVSSSRIRIALAQGDLASAREMLGRDFAIMGRIVAGNRLGRQLGAPTANILLGADRMVMQGVFVVKVGLGKDGWSYGVANLGFRPTVDRRTLPILEVHLLDFSGDLYGRRLCVGFLQKIRDERHFSSQQDLARQIRDDIDWARQWLAQHDNGLETR